MSKKKWLPFGMIPSNWGLKGKMREVAEAEYKLSGEELQRELIRINLADRTEDEIKAISLKLDLDYGHITKEAYDFKMLDLRKSNMSEKDYELEKLDLQLKHDEINDDEYNKKKATILEEPYVRVTNIETDPDNPSFGGIGLDWNKSFVLYLEANGYGPAPQEEDIIDEWFTELCKNIALDAFDGVGDFNEKLSGHENRRPDVIYKKDLEPTDKDNKEE